ncbi:MAG: CDP-alcohol phosphatidyltransferase family protein, partial [Sedimentisphaerales bacterium]|nr:CDP-alcohol phosphatidyltransferase family protein [Sedimentisphaerales bacterium]
MGIIKEMREVCQQKKMNAKGKMVWTGYWFNAMFTRYISIYFTWLFIKMGLSANAVTFMMIPVGLLGAGLCIPHILWLNILGILLLMFAVVLDCSDGEVARWTKKSSIKGYYLDNVYHVLCHPTLYILCSLHLYFWNGEIVYLILAFVSYAMSQSSLSLLYVDLLVKTQLHDKGSSNSPSTAPKPLQVHSLKQAVWRAVKMIIAFPSDKTAVESTSVIGIIISYAGITWLIVF